MDGAGGVYCEDCKVAPVFAMTDPAKQRVGVAPYAVDATNAKRLWELSEKLTGVSFPL